MILYRVVHDLWVDELVYIAICIEFINLILAAIYLFVQHHSSITLFYL
jgi:hypothetical protein